MEIMTNIEGVKYSEHCIYGEDNAADATLTMCEGCKYKIREYIDKLHAGTATIGEEDQ